MKSVDSTRTSLDFNESDRMLIKIQPALLKFFRKVNKWLVHKYEGPFPVARKLGKVSYRL